MFDNLILHMERAGDEYPMQIISFIFCYWCLSFIIFTALLVFTLTCEGYLRRTFDWLPI